VNVSTTPSASFRVKAVNDAGLVIAVGQSPEIELELATPPVVRVFMQRPATFGRTFDLDYPRRNMVAVPAVGIVGNTRARPITVALFGLGNVTVPNEMGTLVEKPSEVLMFFNPVTQIMDGAGVGGMPAGTPHPRVNAAATVMGDGRVLIFGGEVTVGSSPPVPSAQLDAVQVSRVDFDEFDRNLIFRESMVAGVARVAPALVFTDATYAIGGRAGGMPLDTIVQINPDADDGFKLGSKLAAPRDRHTATAVSLASGREALIFGGAAAMAPVAEVLVAGGALMLPTGNAGPPRRDHAAVVLPPGDRVLVIGGRNDGGVLGDTVLYQGANRAIAPATLTLKRARAEFAAFVVGDELVVAGG
ncbi:MAG TPA: kelch repeat-containing protein, partial [Acidimicrobiales bacterium]|nr:kelch repeat-containing protein [Acidimicrobiales bacterium]